MSGLEGEKELHTIFCLFYYSKYYESKGRNGGHELDSRDPNYINHDNFLPLFLNYLEKRGSGGAGFDSRDTSNISDHTFQLPLLNYVKKVSSGEAGFDRGPTYIPYKRHSFCQELKELALIVEIPATYNLLLLLLYYARNWGNGGSELDI